MTSRQPRRLSLPLWKNEWAARDEIIAAVEPLIRPYLHGMTWTAWREKFRRVCQDMAESGVTPSEAVEAVQALGRLKGAPIYSMYAVRGYIASRGPKGAVPEAPHAEEGEDIRPLGEIIAEQKAAGVYSGTIRQPLPAPL